MESEFALALKLAQPPRWWSSMGTAQWSSVAGFESLYSTAGWISHTVPKHGGVALSLPVMLSGLMFSYSAYIPLLENFFCCWSLLCWALLQTGSARGIKAQGAASRSDWGVWWVSSPTSWSREQDDPKAHCVHGSTSSQWTELLPTRWTCFRTDHFLAPFLCLNSSLFYQCSWD